MGHFEKISFSKEVNLCTVCVNNMDMSFPPRIKSERVISTVCTGLVSILMFFRRLLLFVVSYQEKYLSMSYEDNHNSNSGNNSPQLGKQQLS